MSTRQPTADNPPTSDVIQPERSVLSLIRGLQNGSIQSSSLDIKERRLCVEHLTGEGFSISEIAEILKASDRLVSRDRAAIRQANAVEASPELTSQMVGNLLKEADTAIGRIRRATRASDAPVVAKIEAERSCWVITRDLVHCLQKLGYLPTTPHMIQGHLTHDVGGLGETGLEAPEYSDLQQELERLESIHDQGTTSGGAKDVIRQITEFKSTITRLLLSDQIKQISAHTTPEQPGEQNHDQA